MFNLAQILQQFQGQPWNRQLQQSQWMQQQGFQPYQGGMNRPVRQPMQPSQGGFMPFQGGANMPTTSPVGMPFGQPQQPPTMGGFMPYNGGANMPTTMPVQQQPQPFQPINRFGPAMWRR